jgi:hypothetical protein
MIHIAPQVYETSGGPGGPVAVTVASVVNGGPSVSPSLWAPHAYAPNAPYPSPPVSGPPVGPPQGPAAYAEHPGAYLGGPPPGAGPIYTAPPQFIQDPGMLSGYPGAAPAFAPPPYHPAGGFQGYPQVVS